MRLKKPDESDYSLDLLKIKHYLLIYFSSSFSSFPGGDHNGGSRANNLLKTNLYKKK